MSSNRGRANTSSKQSQSRKHGKSKQAPGGNKGGSVGNQNRSGVYTCEACNTGYLRGLASLHLHQRRLCPVLTRSNLFYCDQCGHGIFRGESSLDLHKRRLCTQVPKVVFTQAVEDAGGSAYVEGEEDEEEGVAEEEGVEEEVEEEGEEKWEEEEGDGEEGVEEESDDEHTF